MYAQASNCHTRYSHSINANVLTGCLADLLDVGVVGRATEGSKTARQGSNEGGMA